MKIVCFVQVPATERSGQLRIRSILAMPLSGTFCPRFVTRFDCRPLPPHSIRKVRLGVPGYFLSFRSYKQNACRLCSLRTTHSRSTAQLVSAPNLGAVPMSSSKDFPSDVIYCKGRRVVLYAFDHPCLFLPF